jgi:hypothetical protein
MFLNCVVCPKMILIIFVEHDIICVIQPSRVRCVNFQCFYAYTNMWEPAIVLYSVDFSLILLLLMCLKVWIWSRPCFFLSATTWPNKSFTWECVTLCVPIWALNFKILFVLNPWTVRKKNNYYSLVLG